MRIEQLGPELTEADFAEFQRQSGEEVPAPVRWLLRTLGNGGWAEDDLELPVEQPGWEGGTYVHGLLGINHPSKNLDMLSELLDEPVRRRKLQWPIGFDPFAGYFVVMRQGPFRDQVRYVPVDQVSDRNSLKSYFVADDVEAMVKILGSQ